VGLWQELRKTAEAAELARSRVVEHFQTLAVGLEQATQQTDQQRTPPVSVAEGGETRVAWN
jgi:hypothetical protein